MKQWLCALICGNEKQLLLQKVQAVQKELDEKTRQMEEWQAGCSSSKTVLMAKVTELQADIRRLTDECAALQAQVEYWKQHQPVLDYWESYYTAKHNQVGSIMYSGRYDFKTQQQLNLDVREFFVNPDAVELQQIVREIRNQSQPKTNDEYAYLAERWVITHIPYAFDQETEGISEYWCFPYETIYHKRGDCEDMAILLANLLVAGGIPYWRARIVAGDVKYGDGIAGHSWVHYCRESDNRYVNMDPAYDPNKTTLNNRPYWKEESNYIRIWFSFDSKACYSDAPDKPAIGSKDRVRIKK